MIGERTQLSKKEIKNGHNLKEGSYQEEHVDYPFNCLWPCSLAVPVLAGWVYVFVVLCPGTPEGSTGSGSSE